MKKLLLLLVLVATTAVSAQSRKARVNAERVSETEVLSNITGWYQDASTGQWREGANYINYADYKTANQSTNIQSVQFIKYTDGGQEVVGMRQEFKSGYYKYPSIKRDWNNVNKRAVYLFQPEDYAEAVKNINSKDGKVYALKSKSKIEVWSHEFKKGDVFENGKITEVLSRKQYGPDAGLVYQYQNVEGNDVIRFTILSYISDTKYSPLKLDNSYFEVSLEEFSKLLSL